MKSTKLGAIRTRECPVTGIITLLACGALACGEVIFEPEGIGGSVNGAAGSGQAGRAGSGGSSSVSNGGSSGSINGGSGSSNNGGSGTGGSGSSSNGGSGSSSNGGSGSSNNGGSGNSGNGNGGTGSSGTGGTSSSSEVDAGEVFSDGGNVDAGASDAAPDPGPVNLITNPDFESGFSPWTAAFGGVMSTTIDQAHTGSQSGRVNSRSAAYQGAHYNLTSAVTPGATYTVTAFGRIDGSSAPVPASNASLILTARIKCLGLTERYHTIKALTGNDTTWTELSGSLPVPSVPTGTPTASSCTVTEILVYLEGPPAGFTIYIDDVSAFEQ